MDRVHRQIKCSKENKISANILINQILLLILLRHSHLSRALPYLYRDNINHFYIFFQHHLLHFNDQHPDDDYWCSSKVNTCYVDMLTDLASKLRRGRIPNYFNPSSDQLQGKDPSVLRRLAEKLEKRCRELRI